MNPDQRRANLLEHIEEDFSSAVQATVELCHTDPDLPIEIAAATIETKFWSNEELALLGPAKSTR